MNKKLISLFVIHLFQFLATTYDNIPDSSIFTVKIILESGLELFDQTIEINFD